MRDRCLDQTVLLRHSQCVDSGLDGLLPAILGPTAPIDALFAVQVGQAARCQGMIDWQVGVLEAAQEPGQQEGDGKKGSCR